MSTVFNYPTLAECYKVAALNGLNSLQYSARALIPFLMGFDTEPGNHKAAAAYSAGWKSLHQNDANELAFRGFRNLNRFEIPVVELT